MIRDATKKAVLNRLSGGQRWVELGKSKVKVRDAVVHVRYCSPEGRSGTHFRFNINPNTLTADYELWICGDPDHYYLIPIRMVEGWHKDPAAYLDRHHADITVVSVDTSSHTLQYAARGRQADLTPLFCRTLEQVVA